MSEGHRATDVCMNSLRCVSAVCTLKVAGLCRNMQHDNTVKLCLLLVSSFSWKYLGNTFMGCFIWVWNLVYRTKRRKLAEGVLRGYICVWGRGE